MDGNNDPFSRQFAVKTSHNENWGNRTLERVQKWESTALRAKQDEEADPRCATGFTSMKRELREESLTVLSKGHNNNKQRPER